MPNLRQVALMGLIVLPWTLLFAQNRTSAQDNAAADNATQETPRKVESLEREVRAQLPENVLARVNGSEITAESIVERIYEVERHSEVEFKQIDGAFEYLINAQLVDQEAGRMQLAISEDYRDQCVKALIELTKKGAAQKYGGTLEWKRFLELQNFTEELFEAWVRRSIDRMIQTWRLVNYFERTNDYLTYAEIRTVERKTIDNIMQDYRDYERKFNAAVAAGNAQGMRTPTDNFKRLSVLNSTNRAAHVVQYRGEPFQSAAPEVPELIWEKLGAGVPSDVIEMTVNGRTEYSVYMVTGRFAATKESESDLMAKLDAEFLDTLKGSDGSSSGPIDEGLAPIDRLRYRRWVSWVLASGKYSVYYRYPGAEYYNDPKAYGSVVPRSKDAKDTVPGVKEIPSGK